MCELGWKSVGVLELTALPSIDQERWVSWVRETDVLLVNGGDALYLCHWMRQSGLADLLPSLHEMVWVGLSAGSMVMTPRIGEDFVQWKPPTGGDETLGFVDFSICPHLAHEDLPGNTMAEAERWAAGIDGSGIRDRRRDRDPSGRRHRRSRLRGELEAVHRQLGSKRNGLEGNAPLGCVSGREGGGATSYNSAEGGEQINLWKRYEARRHPREHQRIEAERARQKALGAKTRKRQFVMPRKALQLPSRACTALNSLLGQRAGTSLELSDRT